MNEIKLQDKSVLSLENVKKLVEITPKRAIIELDYTSLIITGENLELASINESQTNLVVKGLISNLNFGVIKKNKESFVKKLFA